MPLYKPRPSTPPLLPPNRTVLEEALSSNVSRGHCDKRDVFCWLEGVVLRLALALRSVRHLQNRVHRTLVTGFGMNPAPGEQSTTL
jgi:hypothetical protein